MNKFIVISVLFMVTAGTIFFSCRQQTPAPETAIAKILLSQINRFSALCMVLQDSAESNSADAKQLQQLFLDTRLAYKDFEWAAEYFVPATSRFVNGPPVQEVEMSGQVFQPAGLQIIESLLFPIYDSVGKTELVQQLKMLRQRSDRYKTYFANIAIFNWQVFDAVKLEVFRIMTLGITGFDNPLSQKSMSECAAGLESMQKILAFYSANEKTEDLAGKFELAVRYLTVNTDFNSFNRAEFITTCANPLTTGLTDLEEKLKIHVTRYNRLLNQDAKTLFDTNAFKVDAYAPDQSSFITDEKIALGKKLFSEPLLSGTGTRSCQSCHQPEKAFTDGLVKNTIIGNNKLLARNTPSLLNAGLQPSQFYDLRVKTLEDQSRSVVQSIEEMHGSMQASVYQFWQDSTYRRLFSAAFPKASRAGIDTLEVMNALGSYIRSLAVLNSRFDEYMRGSKSAMNTEEINGFNLFMGKAKCATCHYMPLFNGTFPPRYMKIEAEVIGVPQSATIDKIDPDMGRFDVIRIESFRHAFKTPSVRNVTHTSPYMHNGAFSSLEQVMDFYNKGGGAGLGIKIDNQTLPFDKLNLTQEESTDIIAFMKCLDSR